MNIEAPKQAPIKEKPLILDAKALESMMQVPFENLKATKGLGNPDDPKIAELNNEADTLFDDLCEEIKGEVQFEDLKSAVDRMKDKVMAREAAKQERTRDEAKRLGGEASADYFLDKQMQAENKGKGSLQEKMSARRKKFGPKPPEAQI